jgi:hypothetical protein
MGTRAVVGALVLVGLGAWAAAAKDEPRSAPSERGKVRVATFNIFELSAAKIDRVDSAGKGADPQLKKAAEIVQRVRPDVLLVNEIDYDGPDNGGKRPDAAVRFRDRYLKVGQNDQEPLDYPHVFFRPVNTGVPTGKDLNNDGKTDGPEDAYGFGKYPGQYGMALYSRFPLDEKAARTFRLLRWKDMPGHLIPDGAGGKPKYYSPQIVALLRLSSKSHWDVPAKVGPATLHLLCSHPTPPVFDGPEDRNGRRNFDEVRLWADYLTGGDRAAYLKDDAGKAGGLAPEARFVILGDLNAEPVRAEAPYGKPSIRQLLDHPRVADPRPTSAGGPESGGPEGLKDYLPYKTHGFGRLDYALPSKGLKVAATGVFWPAKKDPLHRLVSDSDPSSDHRLVWVDLELPTSRE